MKDTAYFYFAGNGSTCNVNTVHKPIVFIDGFDPTNSRGVQQIFEDYINKQVTRNNTTVNFGDYMLSQGYDFIILDFKHGNDLIERNALTLVKLLQQLYQTYGASFQQDIVLIGPSMGALVAQYALAYMEHNNMPHHAKTFVSFDGPMQGANVPIGLQNYVEYLTKRGVLQNIKLVRDGLYNGLAARQILAHHVSANSQFPAPDALRNQFLQNLAAVGTYPTQCRKVAIINGTNTGALNSFHPNSNESLLRIWAQRKGWKSIWGACTNKVCEIMDWECKSSPSSGTQKVAEMWTLSPLFNLIFWVPPAQTNYYASAAWNNSALDNAPGGTFGVIFGTQPGNVDEGRFKFLLKDFVYLLTGSQRSHFYQNINQFTMMPSYSSADLQFQTKDLYMRWDNQYLCGKTPFDYVYAPSTNQQHVSVTQESSYWFENEAQCAPLTLPVFITPAIAGGTDLLCSSDNYYITTCKPTSSVIWSSSPYGVVSIAPNPNNSAQATISKIGSGSVTIIASVNFCGSQSVSATRSLRVGGYGSGDYPITGPSNGSCGQYLYFSTNTLPGATNYSWFWPNGWSASGQGTANLSVQVPSSATSGNYQVGVRVANACDAGGSPAIKNFYITCGRFAYTISPNPATSTVTALASNSNVANSTAGSNHTTISEINIYDQSGVLKKHQAFSKASKAIIDIGSLPLGVYIIEIVDKDYKERQQLSIQKQ